MSNEKDKSQESSKSRLKQLLCADRINIHKPSFLPWESAFLLADRYLKELEKDSSDDISVYSSRLSRRWYTIKYAPDKETSVRLSIRNGKTSITVIIEKST